MPGVQEQKIAADIMVSPVAVSVPRARRRTATSHSPNDVDGLFGEAIPLRVGRQLEADLDELRLEEVVVVLHVERRALQPRDEHPQGVQDVGHGRHGLRRHALLLLQFHSLPLSF